MKSASPLGAAAGLLLIACGLVACSPSPADVAAERIAVLDQYLASEQTVMEDLVRETSIYTAGTVTGSFAGDLAGEAFPSAKVTYTYTYAETVRFGEISGVQPSWAEPPRPQAELDAMKLTLLNACNSTVFPAMRAAGLTGPLEAEYVYLNPAFSDDVSWSMTCTAPKL